MLNFTFGGRAFCNFTRQAALEAGVPEEVIVSAEAAAHSDWARGACAAHIAKQYPAYKQLNIMRTGSAEEVGKMGAFIDACRAWSNGDNPDLAALEAIQP